MYDFSKKQKIFLGIISAIVIGCICYYVYAKEGNMNNTQIDLDNNIETRK